MTKLCHGLAGRFSPTLGEFTLQGVPGSIEMTTGTNGVINGSLEMDAYGDLETATGNLQWGQTPYRYIGGLNCQSEGLAYFGGGTGEGNSYRLIMMGERWYDPQVGRFISLPGVKAQFEAKPATLDITTPAVTAAM